MTQSGSAGGDGAVSKRRERFNRWRQGRPFAGGALLIIASLVIAWIPIHIAPDTILIGKALSPIGLLFAALVFLCGIFALSRPGLADVFGIFGGVFSVFSLYGALGGFGIGLVLGLIGANLCYAWENEDETDSGGSGGTESADEASGFNFAGESSDDDSGGLFGTRSIRRGASSSGSGGAGGRTASVALFVVTVVVLAAFAHPLVAAAAQPFPEQTQIDGTVVIANQFSGQMYDNENVTTDTSNRNSVPAGRLSFSKANIDGLTIYKNFRTGPQTPYHVTITGTSSSAPNGLSLTASEFYASQLSLAGVVPLTRNKWTTCPGQDFLLKYGDLGPLPGPPITGKGVTTNTHQLTAPTVHIQNLNLTVSRGTEHTSVQGTPECNTEPLPAVLDLFTANALALLAENTDLPRTTFTNGTVSNLTAPETVNQSQPFNVSATVTNTGYVNDTQTVEYRFDNRTQQTKNVTLERNESTTVTFRDTESSNRSAGTYNYGVFTENGSATGTIAVVNGTSKSSASTNTTGNQTNASASENTTDASGNGTVSTQSIPANGTTTQASAEGNATTTTTATTETTTGANGGTETTTGTGSQTTTTTATTPAGTTQTETTPETETTTTQTPTTAETPTETQTSTGTSATTGTPTTSSTSGGTTNESSLIGFP